MANVYSTLLSSSHAGAGGLIVAFPGTRVVIRDIEVFNSSSVLDSSAQMTLNSSGATIYKRSLGVQVWFHDDLHIVIGEGDTVTIDAGPTVDVTVSGYVLTLP